MAVRKFDREFMMEEVLWTDNVVEDNIIDTTRWCVVHEIVFKHEDKLYQTTYRVGATEQQDERPWEYDKEVECTEVKPV